MNNPYTHNRENKENTIRNLKNQQSRNYSRGRQVEIENDQKLLDRWKQQERDWNRNHK